MDLMWILLEQHMLILNSKMHELRYLECKILAGGVVLLFLNLSLIKCYSKLAS